MNSTLNGPGFDDLAGVNRPQLRLSRDLVLIQAALHQRQGEGRAIDGHVEFGQEIRDRADVVLMAMRQKQRSDVLAVLDQIGEVRRDDIHAEQFGFGEHHAAIDDDDVVAIAQRHDVHAELAEAAQRDYL